MILAESINLRFINNYCFRNDDLYHKHAQKVFYEEKTLFEGNSFKIRKYVSPPIK